MVNVNAESYESLYQKYRDTRVIEKSREYARYTLPKLVSETDISEVQDIQQQQVTRDYQSIGALLLNNLSARLTEYLFPTSSQFVKLSLKNYAEKQTADKAKITSALITIEKEIVTRSKSNGGYADLLLSTQHMAVTGNAAVYRDTTDGVYLVYGVESFSLRRDGRGKVVDAIIKERIAWDSLPKDFQSKLGSNGYAAGTQPPGERCWLYTRILRVQRDNGYGYEVTQQVGNFIGCVYTPGKDYYPEKVCPWLFPVWSLKPGEHYGRGIVEDYAGDFARLSGLSEASHLYMQEAMRVLYLLTGNGGNVDDIEQATVGQVIPLQSGSKLEGLEIGDFQKVQQARDEITQIVQRLSQAFMYTGEFRDSERTTAEEVRQVATNAERGLGGPYATLGKTFQIPLAYVLLSEIDASTIPDIVGKLIDLQVIAGLDALGRSIDGDTLIKALQDAQAAIAAVATINQVQKSIDPEMVLATIFESNGVDLDKYHYTADDLKQMQAQADQLAAQASQAAAPAGGLQDANSISQI